MEGAELEKEIRILYFELDACLGSIPEGDIQESIIWEGYNSIITRAELLTGDDLSRFKVVPKTEKYSHGSNPETGEDYGYTLDTRVDHDVYKMALRGAMAFLKVKYNLEKEKNQERYNPVSPITIHNNNSNNNAQSNRQTINLTVSFEQVIDIIERSDKTEKDKTDAKEKINELHEEIKKENPSWEKVKAVLSWFLNFGREAFLALLPILIEAYSLK